MIFLYFSFFLGLHFIPSFEKTKKIDDDELQACCCHLATRTLNFKKMLKNDTYMEDHWSLEEGLWWQKRDVMVPWHPQTQQKTHQWISLKIIIIIIIIMSCSKSLLMYKGKKTNKNKRNMEENEKNNEEKGSGKKTREKGKEKEVRFFL